MQKYTCLYKKWFCVLSFQGNNHYNIIDRLYINENPLYMHIKGHSKGRKYF